MHSMQTPPCRFPLQVLSGSLTSTGVVCLTSGVPQCNLLLMLKWDFLELLCHRPKENAVVVYTTLVARTGDCCNTRVQNSSVTGHSDLCITPHRARSRLGGSSLLQIRQSRPLSWQTEDEKVPKAYLLSTTLAQKSHLSLAHVFLASPRHMTSPRRRWAGECGLSVCPRRGEHGYGGLEPCSTASCGTWAGATRDNSQAGLCLPNVRTLYCTSDIGV